MEAQGTTTVGARSIALRSILIVGMAQHDALVPEDPMHRSMYGAATRRDLAYLVSGQKAAVSAAEQLQVSEYAGPMVAAWHGFQLPRPRKRTRSIYEMEEREELHAQRQEFIPSDGRGRGKHLKVGI